jgi:hypothetical protein
VSFSHFFPGPDSSLGYVQGMNGLLAPFAFCMTEVDAFWAFRRFCTCVCPTYVGPQLAGVYVASNVRFFFLPVWFSRRLIGPDRISW